MLRPERGWKGKGRAPVSREEVTGGTAGVRGVSLGTKAEAVGASLERLVGLEGTAKALLDAVETSSTSRGAPWTFAGTVR